jgi:hypothetical protein
MCCYNEFYYHIWYFFVGCNKNLMKIVVKVTYPSANIVLLHMDELISLIEPANNRIIILFDDDYNTTCIPIIC